MRACPSIPAPAADNGERCGGVADQRHHRLHGIGAGGLRGAFHPCARDSVGLAAEHVLGQGQYHRPGASGDRGGIGPGDIFGDAIGGIDPRGPLGNRAEEGSEIDFLEAFAVAHLAVHIADEQDHRLRILLRDMDADARIGGARSAGDEGHSRTPRHRAIGAGHEADPAFLTARHHVDGVLPTKAVEDLEKAFAGNGEDAVAPLLGQAIDEEFGGGGRIGRLHAAAVSPAGRGVQSRRARAPRNAGDGMRRTSGGQPRRSRRQHP